MIDKTQRLYESLDSFLTEYKEKNEGNKYRPVAVGRYGIRTRESIYSKELAKDYSKNKLIFKNTLTVGMGSTQIDIGVLSEDATYAVSPAYHTYRIHDINSDYLRYCLECRNQDMFVRYVKRGSRQGKSIDLKRWIKYRIPVYPESVQAEIVKRLDSVKAILSLREQELNALDDLIKARFVEMFGDPRTNTKGFKTKKGFDLFKISNGKTVPNEKRFESGIPAYGGNGISWYTDEPLCDSDTIVIGRVGFQSGNVHLVKGPLWITDNAMYISDFYDDNLFLVFLHEMMEQIDFTRHQDAGDLKKVTQRPFMEMEYIVPSKELQHKYIDFVNQIDKSKHHFSSSSLFLGF